MIFKASSAAKENDHVTYMQHWGYFNVGLSSIICKYYLSFLKFIGEKIITRLMLSGNQSGCLTFKI